MKAVKLIISAVLLIVAAGCITKFFPDVSENAKLLIVDGMVTDQPEVYTVKLTQSTPLESNKPPAAVTGASVSVTDDLGDVYVFSETSKGVYSSDSASFRGVIGRKYTLHVKTNFDNQQNYNYESLPAELISVPQIDSVYWEKVVIKPYDSKSGQRLDGCQIYIDSYDKGNNGRFFRWNFTETWEFRIPYDVPNRSCWITKNSDDINIESTQSLSENNIIRHPISFVSNTSDRLSVKYSINVRQYSMSRDEYNYWDKIKSVTQNTGGLFDIIPASVTGNIVCDEEPSQTVLGYFSASARTEQRIFVEKYFSGLVDLYKDCPGDTIRGGASIPGLGETAWVIIDHTLSPPPYRVITYYKGCADCTVRGTKVRPSFWVGN